MSITENTGRALAAAAAALVLTGCVTPAGQHPSPVNAPTAPSVPLTSRIGNHLHGLHVDAAGSVLAGTHIGLFAITESGNIRRVGDSDDDFMGLSGVPRSDTLVSSGHPGRSGPAADPLGLRTSADGGRTWTDTALAGEVDFHALATDGAVLVGSAEGTRRLLVSTDGGARWTSGAAISAAALAVTESGVWAVTSDGVRHSIDTARTFTTAAGTPDLVLLAAAGQALWGIDTDGYAWRSLDGAEWQKRLHTGPVQVLTAADHDTAYAATDHALFLLS